MIFEIDNVELYFDKKRILNGIYLKAETGKVTGLLGSNGSGKSCLLDIAFGNLTPKYQLLRIDNKPILKPLYKTKLASFLPQYNFTPNNIKIKTLFNLFEVDWDEFIQDFNSFSKYKNYKPRTLSGGERRVIETYLALKKPSEIILLDEPFSHVAPIYIEKIQGLIEVEKRTKAIVITDHMYKHIIDNSDTLYLLENGHTKLISDLKELEDYKYLSYGTIT